MSDFQFLHDQLLKVAPFYLIPPCPAGKSNGVFSCAFLPPHGCFSIHLINPAGEGSTESLQFAYQEFLSRLTRHPNLATTEEVRMFFEAETPVLSSCVSLCIYGQEFAEYKKKNKGSGKTLFSSFFPKFTPKVTDPTLAKIRAEVVRSLMFFVPDFISIVQILSFKGFVDSLQKHGDTSLPFLFLSRI